MLTNDEKETLIIELGIDYHKILSNINGSVVACLISHEHSDHLYKDNDKKLEIFFPILKPQYNLIGLPYTFGHYKVTPLQAKHDVECNAYLIECDNKTILFATDTYEIPKVPQMVDVFLIEINHIEKMVLDKLAIDESIYLKRALTSHSSLERTSEYFKELEYKPEFIHIIHASSTEGNIDKNVVLKELKQYCDKVDFAQEGEIIDF